MDVSGFGRRIALSKSTKLKPSDLATALITRGWTERRLSEVFTATGGKSLISSAECGRVRWALHVDWEQKAALYPAFLDALSFADWLNLADRAEQVNQDKLYAPIWPEINLRIGTSASSIPELVEQLGIARFGQRPVVGDAFCGGGSIPFEGAQLGCDVAASDLNPIACMLTWGALNIVGADLETRVRIENEQKEVAAAVDAEVVRLGIEHNERGDRAKAYLYCFETLCPTTGYLVPMLPNRIISRSRRTIAVLEPDHGAKRFQIRVRSNVSDTEMTAAETGTVDDGDLVVTLNGETHRTPVRTLRGDRRGRDVDTVNNLRRWEKQDFAPRPDDIYQERLYAIQWITKATLGGSRQETYFAEVSTADEARERAIKDYVRENLATWQAYGLVPDMYIENGEETSRLGRERGWSHWHHLFTPRDLLYFSRIIEHSNELKILAPKALSHGSKLCRWLTSNPRVDKSTGQQIAGARDIPNQVFDNQALNTVVNFANRAVGALLDDLNPAEILDRRGASGSVVRRIVPEGASSVNWNSDVWITDPPYADAIRYEEITEYFIAWLRKIRLTPSRNGFGIVGARSPSRARATNSGRRWLPPTRTLRVTCPTTGCKS